MSNAVSIAQSGANNVTMRNRLINGQMQIDQRNNGASVTPNNSYTLDRWATTNSQTSKFTVEQTITGVSAPVGFTDYLAVTSSSAYSVLTGDYFGVYQAIEGFNVADFAWGTASAATVTLSFWIRSSLTGTFGGSLRNSGATRSYPFTYTISAANTWEQKSVTIAGDTSGNWATNNTLGMSISFGLGVGATYSGTAGSWAGANYVSATGATSVVGTNGATFYITGVQLEKGSTATPFEQRLYGTELALCQRYYYKIQAATVTSTFSLAFAESTTVAGGNIVFPVSLRTHPSAIEQSGTAADYTIRYVGSDAVCSSVPSFVSSTLNTSWFRFTVAAVLTNGQAVMLRASNTSAYLGWSAEL